MIVYGRADLIVTPKNDNEEEYVIKNVIVTCSKEEEMESGYSDRPNDYYYDYDFFEVVDKEDYEHLDYMIDEGSFEEDDFNE